MTQFMGSYESHFRNACDVMGRRFDVNVVLVYGGAIGGPHSSTVAQNAIFDIVHRDRIDGLLMLSTTLASFCGPEAMGRFAQKFTAFPRCSIGMRLHGTPSVVIDNRSSMQTVVEHMIVAHGCKRIAFIGGPPANPESQLRFEGYRLALERHSIAFNPQLVADGYFTTRGGRAAMEELLVRGSKFDAVVAANDMMALAAIQVLRDRGHRVPRDLAVTGFDNLQVAGLENPPLTTVAQPFTAMTERAFRIVLEQIGGQVVAESSEIVAEFVVRRSCGCGQPKQKTFHDAMANGVASSSEYLRVHAESLRKELTSLMLPGLGDGEKDAARLVTALEAEVSGQSASYVQTLEDMLIENERDQDYCQWLRRVTDCLRLHLRTCATSSLEDLWYEARDLIESASMRTHLQHRLRLDESYVKLLEVSEQAWRDLNLTAFKQILLKALPEMRVQTAFISRYADGALDQLEPFIGLLDGSPCELPLGRFQSRDLIPLQAYPEGRRHTFMVFPLVVESRQLGVAVFEHTLLMSIYQMLRDHISTALGSILLHHEVIQKTALHERGLQERLATTKRMQSLSVLAGGVAHDLNNAIGPLVALPDVILRELSEGANGANAGNVSADLECIKFAAMRAAQTIRDLLTLGRQGRTSKEPLDLGQAVMSCISDEWLGFIEDPKGVAVVVDVPKHAVVIHGAEAHLARAINNLVRNAVEALSGRGEVVIRVFDMHVASQFSGYEAIDPGDYAVVSVSDNGAGIAEQELGRIFEPFFSKKRLGERSGSGLGLAIVHGVVKEHEGFVDVTSRPGVGTVFTLYFPRVAESLKPKARTATATPGRARILIVDDEPIQLRTGRRILGSLGYDVDTMDSGKAAMVLFTQAVASSTSPYDLVILDMNLNEDEDGLDRFDQIRRLFPTQRAIVASGHAPTERVELAFQKGLVWLSKPYTVDALAKAVRDTLADRPTLTKIKLSSRPPSTPPAVS